MPSPPVVGLREQKKQRTRSRLLDVAQELFEEQGFDATTIEQIARVADVAPRTFFRYFTSKEDLVFLGQHEENRQIAKMLRARPAKQSPLEFLVQSAGLMVQWSPQELERARRSRRLILKTPALRDRQQGILAEARELLTAGLTARGASKEDALRMSVLVAAFLATLDALMGAWLDGKSRGTPDDQLERAAKLMREGFDG